MKKFSNYEKVAQESFKPLTKDDVEIEVHVEQDDTPVKGNASASGDDAEDARIEKEINDRLNDGDVWAWATVGVKVKYWPFEETEYLGACSYKDEKDFRSNSYFDDMVDEALKRLNDTIEEVYHKLKSKHN